MTSHSKRLVMLLASLGVAACATRPQRPAPEDAVITYSLPTNPVAAYHSKCEKMIGPFWLHEITRFADLVSVGQVVIEFDIPPSGGYARNAKIISNTGTDQNAEIAVRAVTEPVFPPMPRDVAAVLNNRPFHDQETFTIYAYTPKH
jgi:hypothetical protein